MIGGRHLRLLVCDRGAAVIELAMIAPVLGLLTIGVIDMSNAFSEKLAVEQGTQRAIEKIMQTTETSTVQETLKSEVQCQVNGVDAAGDCKTTPLLMNDITVNFRIECTDTGGTVTPQTTTDADAFDNLECDTDEAEARYISVTAMLKYTPMFSTHFVGINQDGSYHLRATAGMRTK
jgi:Flp pilus assembly protein TadG